MYKITRLHEPEYLDAFFEKYRPRSTHRGVPPELFIPGVELETGAKAFQVHFARHWNNLPCSLRYLPSLASFKRALRAHLFESDP